MAKLYENTFSNQFPVEQWIIGTGTRKIRKNRYQEISV